MQVVDEERPMPALWGYVQKVYMKMEDESSPEEVEGTQAPVYTGHLTQLFQAMGIPNPYYTSVMSALKSMGCVIQLRRGGGTAHSRWMLIAPPTEEAFLEDTKGSKTAHHHRGRLLHLEQGLRDLGRRVQAVEDRESLR